MSTAIRINYSRVILVMVVTLMIASAWLVFPYLIQGRQLLQGVGDNARLTKAGNVSMYLTRYLVDTRDLELTATFAASPPINDFIAMVSATSPRGVEVP